MQRFYFHVRSDGKLAEDSRGPNCDNERAACAFAVESMPRLLRKGLGAKSTHVSTQICNVQHQTIAVVRGTITL